MKILLLLLLMFPLIGLSQPVETVRIGKHETFLFRGQSQEVRDCYIYIDNAGMFYMVTLNIQQSEVSSWFEKRKDSQNLYKGTLQNDQYKTLTFIKDNEPGLSISFYYERKEKSEIQLISLEDGRIYTFRLVPGS